jgi:hypothetical protein
MNCMLPHPSSVRSSIIAGTVKGYLLELVGATQKTGDLADYIAPKNPVPTPLVPSQSFGRINQLKRLRILVNANVEAEV